MPSIGRNKPQEARVVNALPRRLSTLVGRQPDQPGLHKREDHSDTPTPANSKKISSPSTETPSDEGPTGEGPRKRTNPLASVTRKIARKCAAVFRALVRRRQNDNDNENKAISAYVKSPTPAYLHGREKGANDNSNKTKRTASNRGPVTFIMKVEGRMKSAFRRHRIAIRRRRNRNKKAVSKFVAGANRKRSGIRRPPPPRIANVNQATRRKR